MSGSVVGRGGIDNAVMLVGDESDDIERPSLGVEIVDA